MKWTRELIEKMGIIDSDYYNCMVCHQPQSNINLNDDRHLCWCNNGCDTYGGVFCNPKRRRRLPIKVKKYLVMTLAT